MRYCSVKCCDVNDFSGTMIHKFKKEWRDLNCWKGYFKTIVWFEVYIYIPRVLHIQIKPYCLTFGIESVESTIPSVQHVHCQSIYCFIYALIQGRFQGGGWQSITPPWVKSGGGVPPPGLLRIISHLKYSFYSFYINNKVYLKVTTLHYENKF